MDDTTETAEKLVEQMVAAGEWPEPSLMEAILAKGKEAVAPLIEVVSRDLHGWPEEAPISHAIDLLADLADPAAAPALISLLRRYDNELLEGLESILARFGPSVVDPLLEIVRDEKLTWYPRTTAATAARQAAGDDSEARARVAGTLREVVAKYVAQAKTAGEDEFQVTTFLVVELAEMADPEAKELIRAAFEADLIDQFVIGTTDVEELYSDRLPKRKVENFSWVANYRQHYEEHRRYEAQRASPKPPPMPTPVARIPPPPSQESPVQPLSANRRKIGRNDPCWCGSGKKYKHCHLRQDQQ